MRWAWRISCLGASATSFAEAKVLTISTLSPELEQKLVALAPVLLLPVSLVSWNGTAWSGAVASGCFLFRWQLRSGATWNGRKAGKSADPFGKCLGDSCRLLLS